MKELRNAILTWLEAPDPIPHHRRTRKLHRAGTGDWFLQHQSFVRWKHEMNSIIWMYGKCMVLSYNLLPVLTVLLVAAGAGKTVLLFVFGSCNSISPLMRLVAQVYCNQCVTRELSGPCRSRGSLLLL